MQSDDDTFMRELDNELDAQRLRPSHLALITAAWGALVLAWCWCQAAVS